MKSMLSAITLEVIDKIFSKHTVNKIGASTQMLYINCLTKHFRNLECKETNAQQFPLFTTEFPNYEVWKPKLVELHHAGLVSIMGDTIFFINHWAQYIDRTVYDKTDQIIGFDIKTIVNFEEDLRNSQSLLNLCAIKNQITPSQTLQLLDLFIFEQTALATKYLDEGAVKKHFLNWLPKNVEELKKKRVTSQTKLLGDE
jgi:hypothetical protein